MLASLLRAHASCSSPFKAGHKHLNWWPREPTNCSAVSMHTDSYSQSHAGSILLMGHMWLATSSALSSTCQPDQLFSSRVNSDCFVHLLLIKTHATIAQPACMPMPKCAGTAWNKNKPQPEKDGIPRPTRVKNGNNRYKTLNCTH